MDLVIKKVDKHWEYWKDNKFYWSDNSFTLLWQLIGEDTVGKEYIEIKTGELK